MPLLQTEVSFASTTSGGSPSTPKATSPEQRDIEAIWRQVHEKVIQLAGSDPQFQIEKTLDIDGVLRRLGSLQQAKKEPDKFGLFKHIVHRTLQCIQHMGWIVADGASTVFGPSQACYNALTFVIQAWQNYEGMFENLAELLEKCSDFLTRLQYYEKNMDANLSRLACQNLRIFIEICDRTIKLRKRSTRIIRFTKQLFLNDDGIQDLLNMMEKLNNREVPLVSAQIFKKVMDNEGKLDSALEEQRLQREDEGWRKRRRAIAAALGFPRTTRDTDGEPIQHWQRTFEARKATIIDGTGEWIGQNGIFLEWAESKLPTNPVLVLHGRNRTGKTSMMANVIRSLRRMDHVGPTPRKALIYFFPETDRRKSDDEDTSTFIERISRVLLWQISTAYEAMTKSIANIIEHKHDFDGSLDLWDRLFIDNKERRKDTTFYIFIDGFDSDVQSLMPLLERLCSVTDEHRPRIFLTARPETVTGWLGSSEDLSFESIPISDHNGDDVHKYITYQMDNMLITKNPDENDDVSRWRQRIHDELYEKCGGDYFKLNNTFDKLAKVDLVEDVEKILEDAGKTRTDQIDAEIRRLNKERTRREIQEINEIVLWIEGGREWFSVEMMEAFLSLRYRRSTEVLPVSGPSAPVVRRTKTGSPRIGHVEEPPKHSPAPASTKISLLPFSQKLQEKYGLFAITNANKVDWRSSEYKERVPSKSFDPSRHLNAASTTGPQVIQESEIEIVRHFLRNVCPQQLYDRFEFDQFFDGKIGAGQKEYISIDDDNDDIKIAIACLTILTEEEIRRSNTRLRYYATYWLLDHLKEVELSLADRELKAEAGPLLVRLFTEEVGIDSLFWPFDLGVSMKTWRGGEQIYLREARAEWVYSNEGVRELLRWFNDPVVSRSITSEVGKSFMAAVKAPNANLHEAVLSYASKAIANHLFRRIQFTRREFLAACCFLRGYLSRLDAERSLEMPDDADPYRTADSPAFGQFEDEDFTLEEVLQIEAWAAEILERSNDSKIMESLWEIHGALVVFQLCGSATEFYQARARKALELYPQNWHACHFIASQPNTGKDEALKILWQAKKDIDKLRKNKTWIEDSANSALLARITLKLGECLWESGKDNARAAEIHRESLEYHYVRFKDYGRILEAYRKRQCWDMLISFVKTINDRKEIWATYFDELVNEFLLEFIIGKESNILAEAADAVNQWDVVETFFEIVTETGRKSDAHDLLFLLRVAYAETLEEAADNANRSKVIDIREAALHAIRSHPSDILERKFIDGVVDSLAQAYLDLAAQPGLGPEQVQNYGTLIESLIPETDETYNIFLNSLPTCCLIRFHHKHQLGSRRAADFTNRIIRTSVELLSDDDEGNDVFAYWLLTRLTTAVGDVENMRITWAMRNLIQHKAERAWESWQSSKDVAANTNDTGATKSTTPSTPSTPARSRSLGRLPGAAKDAQRPKQSSPGPSHVRGNSGSNSSPKVNRLLAVTIPPDLAKATATSMGAAEVTASISRSSSPSGISVTSTTRDPQKPRSYVSCDGCGKEWTVLDVPLYTCADCAGTAQFDEGCYALLQEGELRKRGLKCKKGHEMFLVPKWDPRLLRDVPKGCVPLINDVGDVEKWISLVEWKERLKGKYMDINKDAAEVSVPTPLHQVGDQRK